MVYELRGHLAIRSRFGAIRSPHLCFDLGPWPPCLSFPPPWKVDCRKGSSKMLFPSGVPGPLQDMLTGGLQIQLSHLEAG